MMTHSTLTKYVETKPFRPFRIKMNSGATFDVRHPEMIDVYRTTAQLFSEKYDHQEIEISIILIESIERLQSAGIPDLSRN